MKGSDKVYNWDKAIYRIGDEEAEVAMIGPAKSALYILRVGF